MTYEAIFKNYVRLCPALSANVRTLSGRTTGHIPIGMSGVRPFVRRSDRGK